MPVTLELRRPSPEVAEVWLNRPAVRNAFNEQMIGELTETFGALSADPALRAVVLAAHGSAFCAGGDLHWMTAMASYDWEQNRTDAERLAAMLWMLWSCPVPVVARIQGDCYAGGFGLASTCDVRVAVPSAGFCLSEAKLGLAPATIGPYAVRALGDSAARRYFVTAERFDAATALRLGFLHECVEAAALDATVAAVVAAIVANGPLAVRASKQLVRDVAGRDIDAALRTETARRIADLRCSAEGRAGLRAFLDKQRPPWQG